MKKVTKLYVLMMALALPMMLPAKGQVKSQVISSDYSRNSISNIVVMYNDSWDNKVKKGIDDINVGSKFDINDIPTKTIRVNGLYRTTEEQVNAAQKTSTGEGQSNSFTDLFSGWGKNNTQTDEETQRLITESLNSNNVGKQIFDYVLAVDAQGRFSPEILIQRSLWNATDEDVRIDNASQVKTIETNGPALLANSYVVVYDVKNPKYNVTRGKDGKTYTSYNALVKAYIFVIDNPKDVVGNILNNMWINDDDNANVRAQKRAAYARVRVPLKCIAVVSNGASDKDDISKAITKSYIGLLDNAERKIPAWEIASGIESVTPYITAKIGSKEGVAERQRFKIYRNRTRYADTDRETTKTKKVGYARVTEVHNNAHVATGETGVSYLYQISGLHLKGNEFLKQSNDIGMGLSIDYNYNGFGWYNQNIFGAFSMVDITFDELVKMHRNGISHYIRINFGYDLLTSKMLRNGMMAKNPGLTEAAADATLTSTWLEKGASFFNISAGYVLGFKLKQVMEFQPMINVGIDIPFFHAKVDLTEQEKKQEFGCFVDPGLRILFNCGYPFQLFVQADYPIMVFQGSTYQRMNDDLQQYGFKRDMGLGVAAGFKWTF